MMPIVRCMRRSMWGGGVCAGNPTSGGGARQRKLSKSRERQASGSSRHLPIRISTAWSIVGCLAVMRPSTKARRSAQAKTPLSRCIGLYRKALETGYGKAPCATGGKPPARFSGNATGSPASTSFTRLSSCSLACSSVGVFREEMTPWHGHGCDPTTTAQAGDVAARSSRAEAGASSESTNVGSIYSSGG
eukprot:6083798-Prymnesium_polylepis.2